MGMNINLTPQLEDLVRQKVASGLYSSAREVVREALRLRREGPGLRRQARSAAPRYSRGARQRAGGAVRSGEEIKRPGRVRQSSSKADVRD